MWPGAEIRQDNEGVVVLGRTRQDLRRRRHVSLVARRRKGLGSRIRRTILPRQIDAAPAAKADELHAGQMIGALGTLQKKTAIDDQHAVVGNIALDHEGVPAAATIDPVVAEATAELVIAVAANEAVGARASGQHIITGASDNEVRAQVQDLVRELEPFDIGQDVYGG